MTKKLSLTKTSSHAVGGRSCGCRRASDGRVQTLSNLRAACPLPAASGYSIGVVTDSLAAFSMRLRFPRKGTAPVQNGLLFAPVPPRDGATPRDPRREARADALRLILRASGPLGGRTGSGWCSVK